MGNSNGAKCEATADQLENADSGTRANVFRRYKGRHIVLAGALILVCAYYALRGVPAVADFATTYIAHPWQRFFGRIFDAFPFSVAECLCVLAVAAVLIYLVVALWKTIRRPKKLQRIYATVVALLAGGLTAYALICWFWCVSFYSPSFIEQSGIDTQQVSVEELEEVTAYFAEVANAAGEEVNRDEKGLYVCDDQKILDEASGLFVDLPQEFAFMDGPETHLKPLAFSRIMSRLHFTGVFSPLTGEANISTCTADCYFPAIAAHELAHQRGVAEEQDANFAAVMVCMESGDADFTYSGALLAYGYLSDALKQVSYESWDKTRCYLGESVEKDLNATRGYWEDPQTPAAQLSEAAYAGFLQSEGQELGMKSYGACVDLLVTYYDEAAKGC